MLEVGPKPEEIEQHAATTRRCTSLQGMVLKNASNWSEMWRCIERFLFVGVGQRYRYRTGSCAWMRTCIFVRVCVVPVPGHSFSA